MHSSPGCCVDCVRKTGGEDPKAKLEKQKMKRRKNDASKGVWVVLLFHKELSRRDEFNYLCLKV